MHQILKIFWKSLNSKFRSYFLISIAFSIISSIAEMLTIGSFLPLISFLISPESTDNYIFNYVINLNLKYPLGFENNLIGYLSLIFLSFVILSTLTRILILWWNANFVKLLSVEFSSLILGDMLNRNFKYIIGKDQNKILSIFLNKTDRFIDFIQHYISIICNSIISVAILFSIFLLDYFISLMVLGFFGIFYISLIYFIKSKTDHVSKVISYNLDKRVKSIQDSIIYLRQILLSRSQNFFINKFRKFESNIRDTSKRMYIYYSFPKIFIEALAIIVITSIAFFLLKYMKLEQEYILSILAVIAYASQKLLVYINQIYHSLTVLNSLRDVSLDVINEINVNKSKIITNENLKLDWKKLKFKNISFSYEKNIILKNISFDIENNKFIGISGKTGSGKTTLLDLISLLIDPNDGSIFLDDKNIINVKDLWQKKIAYVPQNIYLSESNILNNIITNNELVLDKRKLDNILKLSCCDDFIFDAEYCIQNKNNESVLRLSGGQIQRLGIARALYQDPDILLLDEATNALDFETEQKLLNNLKEKYEKKCVIIISHKDSTLKFCDKIINLNLLNK
ncbi:ABC transporter ATP-binding protein [Pelagibacterales bacterium SAG-MED02]|nr:ABC transporter ATP-binding protein [Pelagibacterales bacterium SAG-MED02]